MVFYGSQILINWVESDIGIWTGYLYKITSIAGLVLVVALGNLYLAIFRLLLLERVMRALTWFAIGTGGVILILGLPVFRTVSLRVGLRRLGSANFSGGRYVKRSTFLERFALFVYWILCRHGYRDSRFEHGLWVPKLNLAFSQYGFLAFMVIQSYLLAVRNAEAHKLAERLSENLQGEVEAQTHALKPRRLKLSTCESLPKNKPLSCVNTMRARRASFRISRMNSVHLSH